MYTVPVRLGEDTSALISVQLAPLNRGRASLKLTNYYVSHINLPPTTNLIKFKLQPTIHKYFSIPIAK